MEKGLAKIEKLESRISFLEARIENLLANFSTFARPAVKTCGGRITPQQIAAAHGVQTQSVSKYRGIFSSLREFERRAESGRIYFRLSDYEKWVRTSRRTAGEIAAEECEKALKGKAGKK